MDEHNSNQDRLGLFIALILGISGGTLGYLVGLGVGSTLSELALALLVAGFIVLVVSQFVSFSRAHLIEAFPGMVIGLTLETLAANFILSVIGGASAAYAIHAWNQRTAPGQSGFSRSGSLRWVILGVILAGLLPVYLFGRARGIELDVLLAYSLLTSPIWLPIIIRTLRQTRWD